MHSDLYQPETVDAGKPLPVISLDDLRQRAWIDRDTSWLEFNRRVLHEALDDRTPLLERVKFLAIFSSNLDEFFMKRMALIRPDPEGSGHSADDRRDHQLQIRQMVEAMLAE